MSSYLDTDVASIQKQLADHVEYTLARDRSNFDRFAAYQATAFSVKDRLIEFWNDTNFKSNSDNPKRVYYLSIEYLLGRSLQNSLINLNIEENYKKALQEFGFKMEDLADQEPDAGLGNGGLGRLAACYLDSMATQNYAAWGYGIRYTYGMFRQEIFHGWQVEIPDFWLKKGNPWEIIRFDVKYRVQFYGKAESFVDSTGTHTSWQGGEHVYAVAHDWPIPGYGTKHTINLRLWSSEPSHEFDLNSFNEGNYYQALQERQSAETISSVLYPNDNKPEGKELRLKQQYFFVSATLQDIIRRFKKLNTNWFEFPEKVAIQLNDTHPTLATVELMRILMDVEGLSFDDSYTICKQTFSYTNHTVLPEALETWSVPLFENLLPRHLQIIYEINAFFLEEVKKKCPDDVGKLSRFSIIEESSPKKIRMANLAIILSHTVNGVAEIHSNILKNEIFRDFSEYFPGKFINITNGITSRRWLLGCNPSLAELIQNTLQTNKIWTNLDLLQNLRSRATDPKFQQEWMAIKHENKVKLANYLREVHNVDVSPNALFDIQIKRIHEYKRQLLNVMRIIYIYSELRRNIGTSAFEGIQPRVFIFAGKAAPGYAKAKLIIKLINSVSERINNDKQIQQFMKVIFIPNYTVSLAELIIPASDISQHISTAGMEASGTSNMKFALNGGLIVGTLDGANIEIRESIGNDNMFIFGLTADKVNPTRQANSTIDHIINPQLKEAVDSIKRGDFGDPAPFKDITENLIASKDYYLLGNDFASYASIQQKVDKTFKDKATWAKMCILSTAGMGKFSSDRSIKEYAEKIWKVTPIDYTQE